jgi:hypothetical protein
MPIPPIISQISCFHAVIRFTRRLYPISGLRRLTSSGSCVAIPQLHLPLWQVAHRWQPRARSADVAIYTASAPSAIALTTSALPLMLPPATRETSDLMPSSLSLWSTLARASSIGMPTLSRILVGAAPVPPLKPSIAIISAPLLAMPLAIAATL